MIPTESFQRQHYSQREWRHDVLRKTSDPERAWENWMARDAYFGREVARQECRLKDKEADELAAAAQVEFDPAKQDALLARLHTRIVDQSMWIWVVHDLNPRALAPNVKGFVQAQSWFQDLTPVSVE